MKQRILIFAIIAICVTIGVGIVLTHTQSVPVAAVQPAAPPQPVIDVEGLKTRAQAGDPAAQTQLGKIYLDGSLVKKNAKEAVKWLQLAADQHFPDALATLGELYQAGQGVPMDLDKAAQYYQLAGEGGSVSGQYDLAFLYEQGIGVKKDEAAAAKWYQLAAEGGDPSAQYDVGQRYEIGVGVATNRVAAFKWLSLAAGQGQADSVKLLTTLRKEMTGDELAPANQQIKNFVPRAGGMPAGSQK